MHERRHSLAAPQKRKLTAHLIKRKIRMPILNTCADMDTDGLVYELWQHGYNATRIARDLFEGDENRALYAINRVLNAAVKQDDGGQALLPPVATSIKACPKT